MPLAAVWHWFLSCVIISVHFFYTKEQTNSVVDRMVNDRTCPSLLCFLNKLSIAGTNSLENYVSRLCIIIMCFVLYLCLDWYCRFDLVLQVRRFLNVYSDEFDRPEVNL